MENLVINIGNPRRVELTVLSANGVKVELSRCTDVQLILWINGRSKRALSTQISNDVLIADLSASELSYLGEYSGQVKYTDSGVQQTTERVYLFRVANEFFKSTSGTGVSDSGSLAVSVSTPAAINKGYSAYELAVQNGYVGTEKEWIESLSKDSKDAASVALQSAKNADDKAKEAELAASNANNATVSVTAAKEAAVQAAVSANSAANSANTAKDSANTAAANANDKANLANTAANNADVSKTNAEKATADANTATLSAINAATNANAKAVYANEQGDYAKQQGLNAVATAGEAATNADNAAFAASQQAAYAKQQGDYAKQEAQGIDAKIATKADQSDLVQLEQDLNETTDKFTELGSKVGILNMQSGFLVELSADKSIEREVYLRKGITYILQNNTSNVLSFYSVNKSDKEADGIIDIQIPANSTSLIVPTEAVYCVKGYSTSEYSVSIIRADGSLDFEKEILSISNSVLKGNRTNLGVSDFNWELGHIDENGNNSAYDYSKRIRTKGYVYLNGGDTFTVNAEYISYIYIFYYVNGEVNSISSTSKLIANKEGMARVLLIPKTSSVVGMDLANYVSFVPYKSGDSTSVEGIDAYMAESIRDNVFSWENGHISLDGYNSTYDESRRIRSRMMYVKKGDIISLIRFKKEQYIVLYYNEDKTIKSCSEWLDKNTVIESDGFIRILMSYKNTNDYTDIKTLSSCLSYVNNGLYDNYKNIEWELGGIAGADGSNYNSDASMRTKNIIHVEAGTTLVPYVFGRYMIAYYDQNGNFIKRMPNDGEGELNDGYYSQNAFEFKEDCNIRIVLFWMQPAEFYKKEGFEHIIPNNTENLPSKFRIIPPEYSMPYYIKHIIDEKNKEILRMGDIFKATFITDPHEYYYHEMAAVYCAELNSNILLTGGDWLSRPQEGTSRAIEAINRHMEILVKSSVPCVMTKGNHEMSTEKDENGQTAPLYNTELWYTQVQKPLRRNNYQYDGENANQGYFFVDDEKNKVRVICLNLFVTGLHNIGASQRIWLMNVALDLSNKGEDEKNWSVIVVGHSQLLDNIDPDEATATIEEEWVARVFQAAYKKTKTDLPSDKFSGWTAPDFSNIKYQFVAYLCGHSHYDNVSREKDFPHITTTCAHPLEHEDKYKRVWDSVDEYAFDVMCLDSKNRKLIIKRIGVGSDREVNY